MKLIFFGVKLKGWPSNFPCPAPMCATRFTPSHAVELVTCNNKTSRYCRPFLEPCLRKSSQCPRAGGVQHFLLNFFGIGRRCASFDSCAFSKACPSKNPFKRGTTEKAGAMGAEEVVQRLSSGPTIASYKTALFLSFFLKKKKKRKDEPFDRKPNLLVRP